MAYTCAEGLSALEFALIGTSLPKTHYLAGRQPERNRLEFFMVFHAGCRLV